MPETADARFKIGDKVYSTAALDEISIRDLVVFNTEVADLGLHYTWADVERIGNEMAEMPDQEALHHPDAMFITGVTIWASRRAAGDSVTFLEAIDIKIKDLEFLPSTQDHVGPTKAAKKSGSKSGRKGSNRAGSTTSTPTPATTSATSESRSATA